MRVQTEAGHGDTGGVPPRPVFASLLRLQALAFWRAPYLAGRLALAALKAAGVLYAVGAAAILGVVLPDLLGVVAPGVDPLARVETWLLPALAALAGLRLLFESVPTRGARAFLLLPVSRRRIAGAVLARSLASPFNLAPLAFAVPFAARVVRASDGAGGAWGWALAVASVVALSHAALVAWKTQLGDRPVAVVAGVAVAALAVAGLDLASGGLLAATRGGGAWLAAPVAAGAAAALALASVGIGSALSLDAGGPRRRRVRGGTGFERPGTRAFLELSGRMVLRTAYPRGVSVNAVVLSLGMTAVASVGDEGVPFTLLLVFSSGALAGSLGQFAVPFASGWYDRLTTLPGGVAGFVRAGYAGMAVATAGLGLLQAALVLALRPSAVWLVGVSVLFSLGVLAPAALWGSTLGPKPVDLSGRVAFNYKVQSFGGQAAIGASAALAGGLVAAAGPTLGPAVAAALGVAGAAAFPWWLRGLGARVRRQRHAVGARFRATL